MDASIRMNLESGERTLTALSTTASSPTWFTPPLPTLGLEFVDAVVTTTDAQGAAQAQLVIQFFETDLDNPGTPLAVGTSTNGTLKTYRDCQTEAGQNAFYRLGLRPVLSSGTTPATITAEANCAVRQCGGLVARERIVVGPMPANEVMVVPLGAPVPAREYSSVSALIRVIGKGSATSGSIKTRLMSRSFATKLTEVSAWSALEAYDTVSGSNDSRFVSAVSPSFTPNSNQWGQLGLAIETTTDDVSATVSAMVMGAS